MEPVKKEYPDLKPDLSEVGVRGVHLEGVRTYVCKLDSFESDNSHSLWDKPKLFIGRSTKHVVDRQGYTSLANRQNGLSASS